MINRKKSTPKNVRKAPLAGARPRVVDGVINIDAVLVDTQKRGHMMMVFFMMLYGCLVVACFGVQVLKSDYWRAYGESQYLRTDEKEGQRGNILDRHDNMLAMSEPFARIEAEPLQFSKVVERYKKTDDIQALDNRIQQLATGLKMNVGELKKTLYSNRPYVVLAQDLQPQLAESILSKPLPAVRVKAYQSRIYPSGEVSAQIVGVLNKSKNVGEDGLELIYEQRLKSTTGKFKYVRDPSGRNLEARDALKPTNGELINISLDIRIQQYAYKALAEMVIKSKARDGAVLVLDSLTGEILAMAGYPSYNPSNREGVDLLNLRNIALTDIFEPGSTIKPFFATLALENNLVQPTSLFDVQGGQITISGHTINDAEKEPPGTLMSVRDIIVHSSNVGIIKVSEKLERKVMWQMLDDIGFGKPLPFSLPGAVSGRFNNYKQWQPLDKASITFGSTLSTNLLQLVRAYSVFAHDGEVVQPTLQYSPTSTRGRKVFSSKTIKQMNAILESTVSQGTGKQAQVPGYRVAGKTGTAKKFVDGKYANKYISTFIGFAPVSQPRLIVAVMVNEPAKDSQAGYYGGSVAAPVFSQVMGHALRLMDIKPDRPFEESSTKVTRSSPLPNDSSDQPVAKLTPNVNPPRAKKPIKTVDVTAGSQRLSKQAAMLRREP